MVQAGIERVKPRVIACGEGAAAKGTVRVAVTVAADGSVAAADVTESPSTELGSCVVAAMRFGKFAKTSLGGSFVYPFVF
jgi:TonB family protein